MTKFLHLHRILTAYFVSGFCEGESCFSFSICKDKKYKTGRSARPEFRTALHKKDRPLLEAIKTFFDNVGCITKLGEDSIIYKIRSLKELVVIINHFDEYTLITQKLADYLLFKKGLELIEHKKHLTTNGLQELINIKASINNGLSNELRTKAAFPDTIPTARPLIVDQSIKDPN
jgi:LAGLIDADG endonuclease